MRIDYCFSDLLDEVEFERDKFLSDEDLELTLGSVSYMEKIF